MTLPYASLPLLYLSLHLRLVTERSGGSKLLKTVKALQAVRTAGIGAITAPTPEMLYSASFTLAQSDCPHLHAKHCCDGHCSTTSTQNLACFLQKPDLLAIYHLSTYS